MKKITETKCPKCKLTIRVEARTDMGSIFFCSRCHAKLKVISINPVKLKAEG